MDKVFSVFAFNARQLEPASQKALKTLEDSSKAALLLVHNASRFIYEENGAESTKKALTSLRQECMELGRVFLATVEAEACRVGEISRAPVFFRGLFNVILSIRKTRQGYRAALLKHHYKDYPLSGGFTLNKPAGVDLMGRVTPSFRQIYHRTVEQLRRRLREAFINPRHRAGFDYLLENAWEREGHAMAESGLPVIDAMNLTASMHLASKIKELEDRIAELERKRN